MPTILQVLPAELLGMDMARVVQGLQTVGYVLLGLVGLVMAVWVYFWPYSEYFAVERNLPGPPRSHWFFGNIHEILNSPPMSQYCSWLRTYGGVVQYRILFNLPRITLSDLSAVSYLLNHPELFPKPAQSRQALSALIGEGLILVEGATHKRQRRILNPSFNLQVTKDVLSIFWEKGYELKDKLAALIADDRDNEAAPTPPKKEDVLAYAPPRGDGAVGGQGRKVDVLKFVSMASIDIIGLAGFDYDFKALSEPMNELSEAFKVLFNSAESMGFKAILQAIVPFADRLPTKRMKSIWENQAITRRIGMRLVESKKQAILAAQGGHIEKSADIGRDLLSICIKANMAADLKPEQKLTDDEVLAQITTFMLAGQETTSTGITSVLYLLALHPAAQAKLREEVMTVTDDRPGYDELTTLPYLDAVIRETLRLFPPAPATTRIAAQDVELPLSVPIKGKDGKMMDTVKLGKGANILLPIMAVNHSTEVWGPDATHFVPERHMQSIPEGAKGLASGASTSVPGVWGNNLTFLGGTRNCIGYKFALAEMKALLFVLLREFAFEQLPSKPRIEMKAAIVMRSRVVGEASAGHQMPLLVRSLAQE